MQLAALRALAQARGWEIAGEYVDTQSGGKETRPELDRLLADAAARRFAIVATWKIDRLSRSLGHLVRLLDELRRSGIAFASATEPFDTSTPAGELFFQMVGAMAQYERGLIRERVRAGVRRYIERHGRWGRRRRVVDVELANMLRAEGRGWREIARLMGVPLRTLQRRVVDAPNTSADRPPGSG